MKIELTVIGKTTSAVVSQIIKMYSERICHYAQFEIRELPDVKNTKSLTESQQKQLEGKALLKYIEASDRLVLLDEHGKERTSMEFAAYVQKQMSTGAKRTIFAVGGPYGFSDEVKSRANDMISLSKMTFPHELIRAIFTEQLYRAFTILNHEPYHHE